MGSTGPGLAGSLLALPQPLHDEVARGRLIEMLEQRWSCRLTLLEAPGGYGKTRALRQAIADNSIDPVGVDVYVPVLRWFGVVEAARAVLAAVVGDFGENMRSTPGQLPTPESVASVLAAHAPTRICVVIDDVHHLADDSDAVCWLDELLRALPNNATLLLAGRRVPRLRTARLEADSQVARVGREDLAFSAAELAELAGERAALSGEAGTWPAFARLALEVGRVGALDYLLEEIVASLPIEQRRAVAILCLAGVADNDLFASLDLAVEPRHLAGALPLIEEGPDGTIRPHDLLLEAAEQVMTLAQMDVDESIVSTISRWLSAAGRFREAVDTALRLGHPKIALEQLLELRAEINDATLDLALLDEWLEAIPRELGATGEVMFLRSLRSRIAHGPTAGMDDLERSLEAFRQAGNHAGLTAALLELFFCSWMIADLDLMQQAIDEGTALGLRGLAPSGAVVKRELLGRVDQAHEMAKAGLGPEPQIDEIRWAITMALVAGDPENCLERANQLVASAPGGTSRSTHTITRFLLGDIDEAARRWGDMRYRSRGNHRDDFLTNMYSCWVDASLGYAPRSELVAAQAWDRLRERFFVLVTKLWADVIADKADAEARFASAVLDLGLDEPLVRFEQRRFLAVAAVASSEVFDRLDADDIDPELSPFHRVRLDLARLVRAARARAEIDPALYPGPGVTISSLPLPWTVEVACALVPVDERAATGLIETLFLYAATSTTGWLRRFAGEDGDRGAGAKVLLRTLPAPPANPLVVVAQGELELSSDSASWSPSRKRVRQLLSLLVLWRDGHRDTIAETLWPNMAVDRARQNLSVNLTYLRKELEHDRADGEPHFHVRQSGERLQLFESDHLKVDLWELEAAIADGDSAPWRRWTGPILPDLREVDGLAAELHRLDVRVADAVAHAGAQELARGRHQAALAAGRRLLEHDRFDERGHRLVIAGHVGLDQRADAGDAYRACVRAMDELGVEISPQTRMLVRQARGLDPAIDLAASG